ncbi:hypothetical protein [Komagataeibacter sp. NFXK3]
MSADIQKNYPARYYAAYDATAAQPTPVTGWYDVWSMNDVTAVPAASAMIALTEAQWAARLPTGQGVQAGAIVSYTPPAVVVPLKTQAQNALTAAASSTWQAYGMYGETTPADVVTYLKALQAIANGTDTTSTALPAAPADLNGATASTTTATT